MEVELSADFLDDVYPILKRKWKKRRKQKKSETQHVK